MFTIVMSHFIQEGKEKPFETALKKVIQQAKAYDGYEGIQIIRPQQGGEREYILLIRFDSEMHYQSWVASEPRSRWFEELKSYVYRESEIRYEEGVEFWFSLPKVSPSNRPIKWKMAVLTWMVIYPSVLALSTITTSALPFLPLYLRMLLVSVTLVSLMTYLIMPALTKAFASWIYAHRR